jgi:hypothetical protein
MSTKMKVDESKGKGEDSNIVQSDKNEVRIDENKAKIDEHKANDEKKAEYSDKSQSMEAESVYNILVEEKKLVPEMHKKWAIFRPPGVQDQYAINKTEHKLFLTGHLVGNKRLTHKKTFVVLAFDEYISGQNERSKENRFQCAVLDEKNAIDFIDMSYLFHLNAEPEFSKLPSSTIEEALKLLAHQKTDIEPTLKTKAPRRKSPRIQQQNNLIPP